jgi:hypothetical protein
MPLAQPSRLCFCTYGCGAASMAEVRLYDYGVAAIIQLSILALAAQMNGYV